MPSLRFALCPDEGCRQQDAPSAPFYFWSTPMIKLGMVPSPHVSCVGRSAQHPRSESSTGSSPPGWTAGPLQRRQDASQTAHAEGQLGCACVEVRLGRVGERRDLLEHLLTDSLLVLGLLGSNSLCSLTCNTSAVTLPRRCRSRLPRGCISGSTSSAS